MTTILCIDDQLPGLEVRKAFLEAGGYRALIAGSGPEGLQIAANQPVDLVLLDYRMEGMDGVEVATRLRKLYPQLPVIMLTGYALELPRQAAQRVNRVIAKGRSARELLQAIEQLLGENAGKQAWQSTGTDDLINLGLQQAHRSRETLARGRNQVQQARAVIAANRQRKASRGKKPSHARPH